MRFSHKAQSTLYSILLPQSLDTFQCRTYSAQIPLPGEHSLPDIAACENGAGNSNSIICHILPVPIYSCTHGWRAAMWINCLAEGKLISNNEEKKIFCQEFSENASRKEAYFPRRDTIISALYTNQYVYFSKLLFNRPVY